MHTEYEKPVCEVLVIEIEGDIMSVSNGSAPTSPKVNTGGSSDEKDFWSR